MLVPCTDREKDAGATEGVAHVVVLGRTPQSQARPPTDQSAIMFSTLRRHITHPTSLNHCRNTREVSVKLSPPSTACWVLFDGVAGTYAKTEGNAASRQTMTGWRRGIIEGDEGWVGRS